MHAYHQPFPFAEKRLAKLLRQGALAHIQRDYGTAQSVLSEAMLFMDWAQRDDWRQGEVFVARWSEAVQAEGRGEAGRAAPAAWIHLSQEMASLLENGGDWTKHLAARWKVAPVRIGLRKRLLYGVSSLFVFALSVTFFALMFRNLAEGRMDWLTESPWAAMQERTASFFLILVRVAGTVWMIEHGWSWACRALTGRSPRSDAFFLAEKGGPTLLH